MRPSADLMLSICCNYAGPGYYVGDLIPEHKLEHFRRELGSLVLPPGESVIALFDCTLFGSNKEGLAICTNGVYWNNDSSRPQKGHLSWEEIAGGPIRRHSHSDVQVGTSKTISLAGCGFSADNFSLMMIDIQTSMLRAGVGDPGLPPRDAAPPLPTSVESKWQLAVSGTQSGWYAASTIRSLISAGRVVPAEAMVWKPGFPDWVPVTSVPELSGLETPGTALCASCGYKNDAGDRFCGGCGKMLPNHERLAPGVAPTAAAPSPPPPRSVAGTRDAQRLDVNRAPIDALLGLPRVTLAAAAALAGERDRRGGFSTVEEVGEFLSLQPHEVERLRERITFGPYPLQPGTASPMLVDLNRASESELAQLPGIGPVYAKKAVSARARNGEFTSLDHFGEVLNLPPHTIERLRGIATAGSPPRAPVSAPGRRVVDY